MENPTNLELPIDIQALDKTSENIALKKIDLEAEKLKLEDLGEIMLNFKQLTDAYINISKQDYTEKGYDSLLKQKAATVEPVNNTNHNPVAHTLKNTMKKTA